MVSREAFPASNVIGAALGTQEDVSSTEVNYTVSGLPNGNYYLLAVLYSGREPGPGSLITNDRIGAWNIGKVPPGLVGTFVPAGMPDNKQATPDAIAVNGANETGISFSPIWTVP